MASAKTACTKCGKPIFRVGLGPFCRSCFLRNIESRVGRKLRKALPRDGTPVIAVSSEATRFIISRVLKRPHKLVESGQKSDVSTAEWTVEDVSDRFLSGISNGNLAEEDTKIAIWSNVLDDEKTEYCKVFNIPIPEIPKRPDFDRWRILKERDGQMALGLMKSIVLLSQKFNKR